jgi:hypothetical protein
MRLKGLALGALFLLCTQRFTDKALNDDAASLAERFCVIIEFIQEPAVEQRMKSSRKPA